MASETGIVVLFNEQKIYNANNGLNFRLDYFDKNTQATAKKINNNKWKYTDFCTFNKNERKRLFESMSFFMIVIYFCLFSAQ